MPYSGNIFPPLSICLYQFPSNSTHRASSEAEWMSLALNFKVDADSWQEVTFSTFATSMFSGVVDSNSQYYVHSSEAVFTNPASQRPQRRAIRGELRTRLLQYSDQTCQSKVVYLKLQRIRRVASLFFIFSFIPSISPKYKMP
jgi:hypothetical protein